MVLWHHSESQLWMNACGVHHGYCVELSVWSLNSDWDSNSLWARKSDIAETNFLGPLAQLVSTTFVIIEVSVLVIEVVIVLTSASSSVWSIHVPLIEITTSVVHVLIFEVIIVITSSTSVIVVASVIVPIVVIVSVIVVPSPSIVVLLVIVVVKY